MRPMLRTATLIAALSIVAADARPATAQNTVVTGTVGGVGGLIAGTTVSLGLIVANARMERDFIHGPDDLFSLQGVPIPVGVVAGAFLGSSDPERAERVGYYTAASMALGSGLGAIIGEAMTDDDPSGKWAGSVMGSAAGVVIGILLGSL